MTEYKDIVREISVDGVEVFICGIVHESTLSYNKVRNLCSKVNPTHILVESGIGRLGFRESPSPKQYRTLQRARAEWDYRVPTESIRRFLDGEENRWHPDFELCFELGHKHSSSIVPADLNESELLVGLNSCQLQDYNSSEISGYYARDPYKRGENELKAVIPEVLHEQRHDVNENIRQELFDRREERMSDVVRWTCNLDSCRSVVFPVGCSHIFKLESKIKEQESTVPRELKDSLAEYVRDGPLSSPPRSPHYQNEVSQV